MSVGIQTVQRHELTNLIRQSPHLDISDSDLEKLDAMVFISHHVYSGYADGMLACAWGLVPPTFLSDRAYLWLWSSHLIEEYKFRFIRHSQRMMEKMLEEYPEIVGYCDKDNWRARKWLEWLGAEFSNREDGKMDFVIRKKLHG